jgi:hypothetical protein
MGLGSLNIPNALLSAEQRRYACLGGQFQIRREADIYEMYWINADSTDRQPEEAWSDYCRRSCAEVGLNFERLVLETDFSKEAAGWPHFRAATSQGVDLKEWVVFVADFVTEDEWLDLQEPIKS